MKFFKRDYFKEITTSVVFVLICSILFYLAASCVNFRKLFDEPLKQSFFLFLCSLCAVGIIFLLSIILHFMNEASRERKTETQTILLP